MKKGFYIALLVIYLVFLAKDTILGIFNTENKKLNFEVSYYEDYESLSKLLDIEANNYELVYTKVILRDIYDFFDTITINKGTKNKVKVGAIVVNNEGLIGIVKEVHKNYSKVELLTNSKLNLSVKINNSYGILTSEAPKLIIKNLKVGNTIEIGDKVYTSGLTSVPENILIGEVKEIKKEPLGLEYTILVEPAADLQNLKYLGVQV